MDSKGMEIFIEANRVTGEGYGLRLVMNGVSYRYDGYSMTAEEAEEYMLFLREVYE